MKKLMGIFLALTMLFAPQAAWAKRAEIMLIPTRIVLEKNDRYSTIIIRNTGDATGNLSVDLIDMEMSEDGQVLQMEEGKSDPYSAIPLMRVAPHSITIKPGESQNVRLILRKPENLAAGEYRSHLKVKIEDDNAEETANPDKKDLNIGVKTKLALTIPVIVRTGETTISVKIETPKIIRDAAGKPAVEMVLLREGNRSVMGDFAFIYTAPGGQPVQIKAFPGIPVYRPTPRRKVVIAMDDISPGIDLSKGKLDIVYTAQEKEGGMKLAETSLNLSGH